MSVLRTRTDKTKAITLIELISLSLVFRKDKKRKQSKGQITVRATARRILLVSTTDSSLLDKSCREEEDTNNVQWRTRRFSFPAVGDWEWEDIPEYIRIDERRDDHHNRSVEDIDLPFANRSNPSSDNLDTVVLLVWVFFERRENVESIHLWANHLPETNDDTNSDDQTTDDAENGHEKKKEIQPLNRSIIDGRKKWTNTSTVENLSRTKLFEDRTRWTRRGTNAEQRWRRKISTSGTLLVDVHLRRWSTVIQVVHRREKERRRHFSTHLRDDVKKERITRHVDQRCSRTRHSFCPNDRWQASHLFAHAMCVKKTRAEQREKPELKLTAW